MNIKNLLYWWKILIWNPVFIWCRSFVFETCWLNCSCYIETRKTENVRTRVRDISNKNRVLLCCDQFQSISFPIRKLSWMKFVSLLLARVTMCKEMKSYSMCFSGDLFIFQASSKHYPLIWTHWPVLSLKSNTLWKNSLFLLIKSIMNNRVYKVRSVSAILFVDMSR